MMLKHTYNNSFVTELVTSSNRRQIDVGCVVYSYSRQEIVGEIACCGVILDRCLLLLC